MTRFCPDCGSALIGAGEDKAREIESAHHVGRGVRFAGFLIDWLIVFAFNLLAGLPGLGILLVIVISLFWLLRDVNGASPGKALVGSKVLSRGGAPSTNQQRILRNLPFAVMILPLAVPFLGWVDYPIQGLVFLVEAAMVVLTGDRIGDKMAGTVVAKRPPVIV